MWKIRLRELDRLQEVAATGRVDPGLLVRAQIPVLFHRIQQGHPLELAEEMRTFLHRAAAHVGMSDAKTEGALSNPKASGALLETAMERIQKGSARIKGALAEMKGLDEDFPGQ